MQIQEVDELYRNNGAEQVEQDYRDLVSTFRQLKLKEAIPNTDYLHGLYLIDLMFRNTSHHVRMLNGIGESNWLDVLKDTLVKTLTRIKEKGGFLKAIFVGEGEAPNAIFSLQEKFGDKTVKFITAKASRPVKHFIACDSRMLRLESTHDPITPEMESDSIKAAVYLNNLGRTKTIEEEFDDIWNYLQTQD